MVYGEQGQDDGGQVIRPEGRLDMARAAAFREEVQRRVDAGTRI